MTYCASVLICQLLARYLPSIRALSVWGIRNSSAIPAMLPTTSVVVRAPSLWLCAKNPPVWSHEVFCNPVAVLSQPENVRRHGGKLNTSEVVGSLEETAEVVHMSMRVQADTPYKSVRPERKKRCAKIMYICIINSAFDKLQACIYSYFDKIFLINQNPINLSTYHVKFVIKLYFGVNDHPHSAK